MVCFFFVSFVNARLSSENDKVYSLVLPVEFAVRQSVGRAVESVSRVAASKVDGIGKAIVGKGLGKVVERFLVYGLDIPDATRTRFAGKSAARNLAF